MYPKALSVLSVFALFARSVVAADCTRSYTVKEGDFCDKISRENNVSTFQLAALNAGKYNKDCTDLAVGSTLCLGGETSEDCQTTYTVKEGDTCDAVSSAAGTNNTILYHNNPQIDSGCTNIYVGEVLCTANSGQVPPIPDSGVSVPITGPPANSPGNDNPPTSAISVPPSTSTNSAPSPAALAPSPTPTVPAGDDDDANLPFCDD